MKNQTVTYSKAYYEKKQIHYFVLSEIIEKIKYDKNIQNTTELVRKSKSKEERSIHKKNLPVVIFQGKFNHMSKHGLDSHSGIAVIDIDNYGDIEETLKIKNRVIQDKHVVFCFLSPSGGLKVGCKIPKVKTNKDYKEYYLSLIDYYYKISDKTDRATNDISRLCFLSHDSNVYINYNAIEYLERKIINIKKPKINLSEINVDCKEIVKALSFIDPDDRETWVNICCALKSESDNYFNIFHEWSSLSSKYKGEDDCIRTWNSYGDNYSGEKITIGTLFYYAKENGYVIKKKKENIEYKDVCKSKVYSISTEKDKILFIIYDNKKINKKNIFCHLVTTDTIVTSVTNDNNDNSDNNDRMTHSSIAIQNKLNKPISRLRSNGFIDIIKSETPHLYELTDKGISFVEKKIKKEILEIKKEKNNNQRTELQKKNKEAFVDYVSEEIFTVESELDYIEIDCNEMNEYLFNYLKNQPLQFLASLKKTYFEEYKEELDKEIVFNNDSINIKPKLLTQLRAKDNKTLIKVVGQLKSRKNAEQLVVSCDWICPLCGDIEYKKYNYSDRIPGKIKCASCSKEQKQSVFYNQTNKRYVDLFIFSIEDLNENLSEKNYVAEEIKAIATNDFIQYYNIKEGDNIELLCIQKTETDNKASVTSKYLHTIGIKKLSTDISFKKVDIPQINKPISFLGNFIFRDYNSYYTAKLMTLLQMATPTSEAMHLLFASDPGTGKTSLGKCAVAYNLKNNVRFVVDATNSSKAGIVGAVTKNEITGKFQLNGSIFNDAHKDGLIVIDELNINEELQFSLNCIMSDKCISINKANIKQRIPCESHTISTINPLIEDYDLNWSFEKIFGLKSRFVSRLDFVLYFPSPTLDEMIKSKNGGRNPFDYNEMEEASLCEIKSYFQKARSLDVKITDDDYEKIKIIAKEYLPIIYHRIDYRHIGYLKKLIKSIARFHLRENIETSDFVIATDLLKDIKDLKDRFFSGSHYSSEICKKYFEV